MIIEKYPLKSTGEVEDALKDIFGPMFEAMLQGEMDKYLEYETISRITDRVLDRVEEWQNQLLKKFYTFLFIDCMYVTVKREYETQNCAVYVILGYDVNRIKDVLGLLDWYCQKALVH